MTALDPSTATRVLAMPTAPFTTLAFGDVSIGTDGANPHPVATSAQGWPAIPRLYSVPDVDGLASDALFAPADNWTLFLAIERGNNLEGDWIINAGWASLVRASDTTYQVNIAGQTLSTGALTTPFGPGVSVVAMKGNLLSGTALATSGDGVVVSGGNGASAAASNFLSDSTGGDVLILGMWLFEGAALSDTDVSDTATAIAASFEEPAPEPPTAAESTVGPAYASPVALSIVGPNHGTLIPEVLWGAWMDDTNSVVADTGVQVPHEAFGPGVNCATNVDDVDAGLMPATVPARFGLFDAASGGDLVIYADVTWPAPAPVEDDPVRFPPGALNFAVTPAGA